MHFFSRFSKQTPDQQLPPYHTFSVDDVTQRLATDTAAGLSTAVVSARHAEHGLNRLRGQGGVNPFRVAFRQVANAMTLVLLAALVLSFVVKDWIEGGVITFIVALNVTIGFFQEYRAEKTMDALRRMASPTSRVVRDGRLVAIPTEELTVGDILVVELGDVVGADCRLFEVSNLEIDEALLTGESLPVAKTTTALDDPDEPLGDRTNVAFASTTVTKGRGRGIVTGVAMQSEIGKIAKTLMDTGETQKTPLQKGLDRMAYFLFGLACIFAVVVFAANKFNVTGEVAIYAIGLGIALIPEGLIAVVTLTMAVGVRRMAKNRALVRKLAALESLGSVTNICSDKTGTLTQSRMVLRSAWLPSSGNFKVTGQGFVPRGDLLHFEVPPVAPTDDNDDGNQGNEPTRNIRFADEEVPTRRIDPAELDPATTQFTLAAALCNMAELKHDKVADEWVSQGDPTETALQVFATKLNLGKPVLTTTTTDGTQSGGGPAFTLLAEFPFDSSVKRMSVVYRLAPAAFDRYPAPITTGLEATIVNDPYTPSISSRHSLDLHTPSVHDNLSPGPRDGLGVAYLKGATERVLECCTHIYRDGVRRRLSPIHHEAIGAQVDALATQGLRVLALAYRPLPLHDLPADPTSWIREDLDCSMTFLGLAGIYDPPRPESWPSVQECYDAGITVHMLTGDHPATAAAIAREVGILPSDLPLEYATRPLKVTDTSPDTAVVAMGGDPEKASNQLVMTAPQFDALTDEEVDALGELPHVIARCSPDTKVKMIQALHRRQRIVAMTGDGVNDSPSLKIANVGIAMGLQGSDVAKQASHIVLTDDNFATIVRAIAEGRRIFNNIQRFVCHMVSGNTAEVIPLLIGLAFIDASGSSVFPLSPVQILFTNMLTSSPPAMSLGMEPNAPDTMRRAPRPVRHGIFTREVVVDILFYGGTMGIICLLNFVLVLFAFGDGNLGENCNSTYTDVCDTVFRARGTLYATMTFLTLLHAYNCRSLRNPQWWGWWTRANRAAGDDFHSRFLANRYLAISITVCSLIVFPTLYIPTVNTKVFKHKPISWEWVIVVLSIILFLFISEMYKLVKRRMLKPVFRDPIIPIARMTTTVSVEQEASDDKLIWLSGKTVNPYQAVAGDEKDVNDEKLTIATA
ncbi:hypothetical protein IWQ60_001419 [Tieghemiomyces parasiticus]|uniref:Cation-transporting P-type ATPase N-terminal domain-containing protein n=1 Tax=Tieghemiomyces parasiticus TaxID=78921 RepID=A0A9W8AJX2_9FUNG|nr:hypothetical protein IWQ60_001419 [Tieghemiomyces parasiticus]